MEHFTIAGQDYDSAHWRRCRVPCCEYVERRGTRSGEYQRGKFVCQAHHKKIEAVRGTLSLGEAARNYPELREFL